MKPNIFIKFFGLVIAVVFPLVASSQTTYVYTKGGKAVEVYNFTTEFSPMAIAQLNYDCKRLYPNVTILGSASCLYNCHFYAWHMKDSTDGKKYWMNPTTESGGDNLSKYWTQDAYIKCDSTNAEKIVYYGNLPIKDENATHSAVKSSVNGYYESKWGRWPLVRHQPNYVPEEYGTHKMFYKYFTVYYGLLTPSVDPATVNEAFTLTANLNNLPYGFSSVEYVIETAKGDDAVEAGYATILSSSDNYLVLSFSRVGIYEAYFRYYDSTGRMVGEYSFEPIIEP
ncbi:MAG: hypothetical protein SPL48_04765 [Bacteroidales bacterium]|nr:hypothetical protein [Bacteroidales bacterium]